MHEQEIRFTGMAIILIYEQLTSIISLWKPISDLLIPHVSEIRLITTTII